MYWYHKFTKHSYLSIRQNPHYLDWDKKPEIYKRYPDKYPRKALGESETGRFIRNIAGLTAKKSYPGVKYYLRVNPSAGALYPNELYFQVRGEDGMEDGVYHYEVDSDSVVLLHTISQNEGLEPYLGFRKAMRGYLFLVSAVYARSAWKYRDRAFRYTLLDAGHLLGSIEASALLKPHAVQTIYGIDRENLNRMFGFAQEEFFLAGASVAVPIKDAEIDAVDFLLPAISENGALEHNSVIEKAYRETIMLSGCKKEVRAPRFGYIGEKLQEGIISRRSQRGFGGEAITKGQFSYIMDILNQPVLSDCDEPVSVYTVVNRVINMPLGLYFQGKYLKYGDFSRQAGYLALEQYSLAAESALTFFFTSRGKNYQALYQKTGIIGHRLYLASSYLDIGCSGIGAYYDDEVNEFLDNDEMVLYMLAIGK